INPVGRGRVVAMRAPGRKDRRQVDDVRAEALDVVEVLLDAAEIAAEPLVGRLRAAAGGQLVPAATDRPLRRLDAETARGEAVGKNLVNDGLEVPCRPAGIDRHDEVVRVGNVVVDDAEAVQPAVADLAAAQPPAIANERIANGKFGDPPAVPVRPRVDDARLPVLDVAQRDLFDARRAQADDGLVPQRSGSLEHVEIRAVVVRLCEQRRGLGFQHTHPLTAPCVSPSTMKRCRNVNNRPAGTAAMRTPAANGPQCSEYSWSMYCRRPTESVNLC